jgi:hypothetical protein
VRTLTNVTKPTKRALCSSSLLLLAAVLAQAFTNAPASAQPSNNPCIEIAAPDDSFQSGGIGLTRPELETLYGPEEVGQGSFVYAYHGLNLHKDGCDLILDFPAGWTAHQGVDEVALAEALLPADAEHAGSFARGTSIRNEPVVGLWRSKSLAERFALMDEQRGGDILIVYVYDLPGFEVGPIQRVELRTLKLPE